MKKLQNSERKGDWIQTFSGQRFYPLDPRPNEIELVDIVVALSNQCRFSGHLRRHYSVLEHSVRVAHILGQPHLPTSNDYAWALLHDAAEAYLQDLPRPLKQLDEFAHYRAAEARLMAAIADRFGLIGSLPPMVDFADKAMLWWEYSALMPQLLHDWESIRTSAERYTCGHFGVYDCFQGQTPDAKTCISTWLKMLAWFRPDLAGECHTTQDFYDLQTRCKWATSSHEVSR